MKGNLLLMRHAESEACQKKLFSGIIDFPLSKNGISQAIKSSKKIPPINFDIVFTSDLSRSFSTATIILSNLNKSKLPIRISYDSYKSNESYYDSQYLPVVETEILRERNYGILQGKDSKTLELKYGKKKIFTWRRSLNATPPGGESLQKIVARISNFYNSEIINHLSQGRNILIVTHQNVLRAFYFYISNPNKKELENIEFSHCEYLHFQFENEKLFLLYKKNPLTGEIDRKIKFQSNYFENKDAFVFISSAGTGSRMGELTKSCPKSLLEINQRPIIDYLVQYLLCNGLTKKISIAYGYYKAKWKPYITKNTDEVFFQNCETCPNLVNSFFSVISNHQHKNIIVISGDIIFNFSLIEEVLEKHILDKNDITVALNRSTVNRWKNWDYIITGSNNIIVDIKKLDNPSHLERYFFIINNDVIRKYTNNFTENLGKKEEEFFGYEAYNRGWTYLIKRLIDDKQYKICGHFFDDYVININDKTDYLKAKEKFINSYKNID